MAFGLISYGGSTLGEDYSAYGKLTAKLKKWSQNETTYFEDLEVRPCTEAELGLTSD